MCNKCGTDSTRGFTYCPYCGKQLKHDTAAKETNLSPVRYYNKPATGWRAGRYSEPTNERRQFDRFTNNFYVPELEKICETLKTIDAYIQNYPKSKEFGFTVRALNAYIKKCAAPKLKGFQKLVNAGFIARIGERDYLLDIDSGKYYEGQEYHGKIVKKTVLIYQLMPDFTKRWNTWRDELIKHEERAISDQEKHLLKLYETMTSLTTLPTL